jgi:hypothetical protein
MLRLPLSHARRLHARGVKTWHKDLEAPLKRVGARIDAALQELAALRPRGILLGPGPGAPEESGVTLQACAELGPRTPLLGVCMGLQCIGQAFGGWAKPSAPLPAQPQTERALGGDGDSVVPVGADVVALAELVNQKDFAALTVLLFPVHLKKDLFIILSNTTYLYNLFIPLTKIMSWMTKKLCYIKIPNYSLTMVPKLTHKNLKPSSKKNINVYIPRTTTTTMYTNNGQKYGPKWINIALIHYSNKVCHVTSVSKKWNTIPPNFPQLKIK